MKQAVRSVERHVLRGRGLASWILIAVVGLSAGATMALVAGGRRAATSYDRLIEWANVDDADLGGLEVDCDGECGSAQADRFLSVAETLPQVESSERSLLISQQVIGPDGQRYAGTSLEAYVIGLNKLHVEPDTSERIKVLEGRMFAMSAANEAVISFDVAERFELRVGDTVGIVVDSDSQLTHEVQVTGIVAYPGGFPSFSGPVDPVVILTPAFAADHPDLIDWTNAGLSVRLRDGQNDLDAYRAAVLEAGISAGGIVSTREQAAGPRQLVRFDAGVLWLLAAVVGFGSLVVTAQILRRAASAAAPELNTLHALGMRQRDLVTAAARSGLRTGVIGVLIAAVIAVAASPLFPVGISRTAEPHAGVHVDFLVLGIGVFATLLLTTLLACAATGLTTKKSNGTRERRYALASFANLLPPAPASGVRLALTPANSGPGAMLRVGLLGIGSVLTILVGALSLTASLDNAIADPAVAGGTWDGALTFQDPQSLAAAQAALASDDRVESVALGGWSLFSPVIVNGRAIFTQILETNTGIDIATDRGRGPAGATDIVLGEAELDALGISVGDEVQVAVGDGPSQTATVVGRAVLASSRFHPLLQGEGAAVTPAFMSRLGDDQQTFMCVVTLHDDSQISRTIQELRDEFDANFAFTRPDRAGVDSLRDVRSTINIVLTVFGILAGAALLHRLVVASRSQRHQIAVLRAIGLTGQQVLLAGSITGLVVVTFASMAAIPVGIVAGVVGWRALADYLGVVPVPIVPATVLVGFFAVLIAVGAFTGLVVVERVRRQQPARLLRTE